MIKKTFSHPNKTTTKTIPLKEIERKKKAEFPEKQKTQNSPEKNKQTNRKK